MSAIATKPLQALVLLTALSSFWGLGHRIWEVDDARYAEVPREMAVSGDWATPTLNGLNYVEKPPLWYWLAAASYKVFGVGEAAARLPLALLSILGLAGVAWLGSWLYAPGTGLAAAVALGTSGLYFFLTHYMTPDLGVTVFLLWATALILRTLLRPEDARWAAPAAWACAALAFLSKGLIAVVFPAGWTLGCLVLFPNLRKGALKLLHPLGPALFLLIAAPWPLLMQGRHPDFFHVFFIEQHFQRFLTAKYNRGEPWYFFLWVLPAGLLPWTPAVIAGAWAALKERGQGDVRGAALLLWSVMVVGFFSTSHSKLATYILPAFPHLCLLAAAALEKPLARWAQGLARVLGGALAAAGVLALFLCPREIAPNAAIAAAGLGIFCLGGALWLSKKDAVLRLGGGGLLLGALALVAVGGVEDIMTAQPIAQAIMARYKPGDLIYTYGTYLHGLPFYTGRRVDRVVNWIGELHYAKRDPANGGRFGDDSSIRALAPNGHSVYVVVRTRDLDYLLTLNKGLRKTRTFANWALVEL